MAFFKSFQQSLPSVTSILDSVSSKVDDLATAVSDVTYTVSDQLTEQVNTIINKVQTEEEEQARKEEAEAVSAASAEDERRSRKLRKQDSEADGGEYDMGCSDVTSTPGLTEEGRRGRKEEKNRSKGKRNADVDDDEEERRERDRKEEEKKKEEDEWEWCYAPSKGWYRKKKEQSQNVTAQPSEEQQNVKSHQEFREEESANVETSSDVQHNQTINGLIQSNSQEELTSEEKHGSPNMSNTATKKKKKRQNSIEDEEDEDQEAHTSRTTAKKTSKAYTEESNEDDRPDKGANISGVSVKKNGKGYVEEDEDEEYSERKQSRASTKKNGKAIIEEEQEEELHGKQVKRSKRVCTEEEEDNEAPEKDLTELSRLTTKKKKEKGYTEEKRRQSTELGTDNEIESDDTEMYSPAKSGKWGKSMEKKSKSHKVPSKEEAKGSTEPRGKEKSSKKNGKERDRLERGSSDSEDERPRQCPERASRQRKAHGWDNRDKCSPDKDGYGSEDSTGKGSVQKTRRSSPLNELQPPPYQDKDSPRRGSRGRSESVEGSEEEEEEDEEASGDPEDTENYLSKGPEEEAPSESTAVLGPEDASVPPLPEPYEPETLGKYGTLDVAFEYNSGEQRLAVTVTAATDIPALKSTGNISWQVHLVLLPTKKQRAKTGVQKGPCPVFTETFRFSSVEQEALADYAVRFRLYSVRRMKKEKVLGEKVFHLTKLNPQGKMALPVTLEPGSTAPGCGSMVSVSRSAGALSYRSTGESSAPELLLGLHYNSTTGRLSAEVIKGSHFKTSSTDKPPNTYVKLIMLDSKGKEMSKCKTSMCRGQPNPIYKETFVFQVALFQLSEVTLQVAVYSKRSGVKRRARLGWVSLGLNNSTEEQEDHWAQMREAQGQQVCQWHALLDT